MTVAAPPTTLLSARHLFVQFGKLLAVRDVSLELRAGELLGLIGPNGAGKTTLLRTLAGLQVPTAGTIQVMDKPLAEDDPEQLQYLGFTSDTPPLYEELTVRNFLRFICKGYNLGGAEARERIDFWLEKVWLTEKAGQKIRGLSRGMRQRVGIARTLIGNPAIILLDEPAAGLDPAGRMQFRQLLTDLRQQGKTLVVSSHILSDLAEYCTHVGMMTHGSMVRLGTVDDIAGEAFYSNGQATSRYIVILAQPVAGLKEVLDGMGTLQNLRMEGERFYFEFSAGKQEAAGLLRRMIAAELPVASFAAQTPDLEQAYLRAGIKQVD